MRFRYFFSYLQERFPILNMGLFAILFGVVFSVSNYQNPKPQKIGWTTFLGIVAIISFFFRLRVFDEIKDFRLDIINHPNRVLQSGKISLQTLISISLIMSISEIFWSYQMGYPALVAWLVALVYALLMRYEFFIGDFLKKYLVLYAFLHLLIMPFIIFWIWVAHLGFHIQENLILLMFFSLISGFAFELARKIHSPDAERATIDSYSKSLGYKNAVLITILICMLTAFVQGLFLYQIRADWWAYLLIFILLMWIVTQYIKSLRHHQENLLRKNEKGVSLLMLISYLVLIFELNS
jgi:4-hydroxybenzoate polyprenyltransferase